MTYNGNGNTGGTVPTDSNTYQQASTVTVLGNTGSLVKTGYTFAGWNTLANGSGTAYTAGQTFSMGAANVTCYAKWTANTVLGYAYVANMNGGGAGSISQYTIGPNGALTPMSTPSVPSGGTDTQFISADPLGKYIYAANIKSNTVSQFTIGADGSLTPMSTPTVATGTYPFSITVDPTGRFAYVANNLSADISQYTIGTDGALTPIASPALAANYPDHVGVHPSGKYAYLADGDGNKILQYTVNQTTGALSPMTPASIAAGSNAYRIVIHPTGKWAYVTNYFTGDVLEYAIDNNSGALSQIGQTSLGAGHYAAHVTVDPSGKYAYVANPLTQSAAVFQYTINADGTLAAMTPAFVAAATGTTTGAAHVTVDATGTYAYSTSGGPGHIVTQFTIGAGGALAPMTPSAVTAGADPGAIVIVNK